MCSKVTCSLLFCKHVYNSWHGLFFVSHTQRIIQMFLFMRFLLSAKPYTLGSSFVCLCFLCICGGKLWRLYSPRRCVTPVGFRPGNSWPFLSLIHVHTHKHAVLPTLPICIPAMSLFHCLALAWHSVCPCVWRQTMNWVFETSQKEIWINRIILCWTVRDNEKWAK